ncbi:hypothetical protein BT63DRAFT_428692 [Microthyrium microscopicum]|uniref:Zn(2)-C6 fungal-type domain-containing protein n=1 Tax=Microthyrium microscopicum TaxID=703497 RepID=A0A6A6U467_9PEZI|nr:hypothetical protein BT63DRAFT_428692 [Microthyrium microscopicum]
MVGVAGKSQACHDCKRRRIKCDYRKPTCERCERANIVCRGYAKSLVFINRTQDSRHITAASVLAKAKSQHGSDLPKVSSYDEDIRLLSGQISSSSYSPTLFRFHAMEVIKKLYLPQKPQGSHNYGMNHMAYILALHMQCEALDFALFAFCLVQVHITQSGRVTFEEALQNYNIALQKLLLLLRDEKAGHNDETLAAIVVLSTCELFIYPNDHGWRAHADGVSHMLRVRVLSQPPTKAWQDLCSRLHVLCVILGLTRSRTPLLANSEWCKVMQKSPNRNKFDELIKIVSDTPSLLEEAVAIRSMTSRKNITARASVVLRSLVSIVQTLFSWQAEFRAVSEKPTYWAVPSVKFFSSNTTHGKIPGVLLSASLAPICYALLLSALFSKTVPVSRLLLPRVQLLSLSRYGGSMPFVLPVQSKLRFLFTNEAQVLHNPSDDSYQNQLFPFTLEFESLNSAILFVLSWAVMVQALDNIILLYNEVYPAGNPSIKDVLNLDHQNTPATTPESTESVVAPTLQLDSIEAIISEADKFARYLCQSIEFCHRVECGTLGPQCTYYAQFVIRRHYQQLSRYERELSWCLNIVNMRGPGSRCGINLMSFED